MSLLDLDSRIAPHINVKNVQLAIENLKYVKEQVGNNSLLFLDIVENLLQQVDMPITLATQEYALNRILTQIITDAYGFVE